MAARILLVLGLVAAARAQPKNTYGGKYKPGWNGEAKTPPLGWRACSGLCPPASCVLCNRW